VPPDYAPATVRIAANLILNDTTLPMEKVAPAVEAHGLDALFIGEHTHTPVATRHPAYPRGLPEFYKRFLDPFVQLSVAAAVTRNIRLGTGVLLVAERNPLELAKSVASLDLVSGGRLEVGVGYGWNRLELLNNGVDPGRRRDVFREKLAVLRRLWTEETTAVDGEFVRFSESWSLPKPLQKPHPPVLIGAAASPATYDDVVNLAEGWYPLYEPGLGSHLEDLRRVAGGSLPPVTVVEMAGQRGEPWYFEDDQARRALHAVVAACADNGVNRLSVGLPADTSDRLAAALEVLAGLNH
jgi:probable F420-dependent oxidoreductase